MARFLHMSARASYLWSQKHGDESFMHIGVDALLRKAVFSVDAIN
jgi:hypothetical protein